jgi:3-oxoacyl-[acyl-carrier-protein] synthase II
MASPSERVAVTGVGMVTTLGLDAESTFGRLCAGDSGVAELTAFDPTGLRSPLAAEVARSEAWTVGPDLEGWSVSDLFALRAASEALEQARFGDARADLALVVGGTTGGMREAEVVFSGASELDPARAAERLVSYPLSTTAYRLSERIAGSAPVATVCSACSSGANAIVLGAAWVRSGRARTVLAGGTDALCRLTLMGFNALGITALEPCRPFARDRAGLSLGEGAGFLVLECESSALGRGAAVLAWLDGWSVGAEAHHITHPEPTGAAASRLVRSALVRAGLDASDVDYVNAHGTATVQNDAAEARALGGALDRELSRIRVSSSKGQIGHTLGAAGAIEAGVTVLALERGLVPPTGGLVVPDPNLPLRHVLGRAESVPARAALSCSFGFGGTGTVLAFTRADREGPRVGQAVPTLHVNDVSLLVGGSVLGAADTACFEAASRPESGRWLDRLDPARTRRFDAQSAMVTLGAEALVAGARGPRSAVGLVVGSAYGNVERSVAFLARAHAQGPRFASPAEFPHLLPSAPAGNASIYLGLSGPVLSVADVDASAESALVVALSLLADGQAEELIAGAAAPSDEVAARLLAPVCSESPAPVAHGAEAASFFLASSVGVPGSARVVYWSAAARAEDLPAPQAGATAASLESAEAAAFIQASKWRSASRLVVRPAGLPMGAQGGVGLAKVAALVLSGAVNEALWVSVSRGRAYAFVFARSAMNP